jgi:hypothetical protein
MLALEIIPLLVRLKEMMEERERLHLHNQHQHQHHQETVVAEVELELLGHQVLCHKLEQEEQVLLLQMHS